MNHISKKRLGKALRKNRVRSKINGTKKQPRLSVTISSTHVSAQLIDDEAQKTLVSATTIGTKQKGTLTEKATFVGSEIAKKAKTAKITAVVLDRNGRQYAGRLKALAEAVRKEGMKV